MPSIPTRFFLAWPVPSKSQSIPSLFNADIPSPQQQKCSMGEIGGAIKALNRAAVNGRWWWSTTRRGGTIVGLFTWRLLLFFFPPPPLPAPKASWDMGRTDGRSEKSSFLPPSFPPPHFPCHLVPKGGVGKRPSFYHYRRLSRRAAPYF